MTIDKLRELINGQLSLYCNIVYLRLLCITPSRVQMCSLSWRSASLYQVVCHQSKHNMNLGM